MTVNPLFQRLALIIGPEALDALERTRVLVFGVGGVGSWCAEALVRSAVGAVGIVDSDSVCVTNINRQVQATSATVGRLKAEALKERLLEINPRCRVTAVSEVFSGETAPSFGIEDADYVIDAIDSLTNKLDLIEYAVNAGKVVYSSMGMAQKLDPARLKTADLWETRGCPLARLVRAGLRKRGFGGPLTVVYSDERLPRCSGIPVSCGAPRCLCPPRNLGESGAPVEWCSSKKVINGSAVTVTSVAGMILASLVVRDVYSRTAAGSGASVHG
ncbi:MAG: tRNA threonylcarbamoyladenosine dehydratase [Treponema sp.]|jgi:tRNA A37 threonylcarbamoyladenosine dehydratase|nr:tRNA threonylcarbamoyladenosine dehydratase [Treponema sp.]